AEQESAHAVDETVDEVLLERSHVATILGVHPVQHRTAEDRVKLHEVLLAEYALGLLPHAEQAPGFEQVVAGEHVFDQRVVLWLCDPAKVGHLAQHAPAPLAAYPTVLERHGQELVHEHRPTALLVFD